MTLRTLTLMAAGVAALAAGGAASAAGRPTPPPPERLPTVPGNGILFAFSGLDGNTWIETPVVATLADGGLTLRFHLPKEPVLRLLLAKRQRLSWRVVSNDLLVADVAGEEDPLVVAFASPTVVVGRIPSGAVASSSGGGYSTVLLRDKVGRRTRFAFAYDPKGSQAAADVAAQAIRVSLETLVETRLDFFAEAPGREADLETDRSQTLAKAFSVMKVNTYSPEAPITVHWTTPARWPTRYQGLWATAFHAVGLMHLDDHLAKEALTAVYQTQTEDGFIPAWSGPVKRDEQSQPPLLARAAWAVYRHDKRRDRRFLRASFDVASRHVLWFLKNRRHGGPPRPEKPLTFGSPLYGWASAEEAGMPGSPRFAGGADVAACDLSCYLADECRILQQMAQVLGYGMLAQTWGDRAEAIAGAARDHLWDADRGFFFDRRGPDGAWVDVWSCAGLLPLALGVADEAQAERLKAHLAGDRFRTPAGVTTLGRSQDGFTGTGWKGAVWPPMTYLLIRGLQERGEVTTARRLAEQTLATITRQYHKAGTLAEFYTTGGPGGAGTAVGGIRDPFPTAAVFADLVLRPEP